MPDDPLYNQLPQGLPPLPQLTTAPQPMAPPLAPVPKTGAVGTPLPAKAAKGSFSALPPLAPLPVGNRPYQRVGAAINEENHARDMLNQATNVKFSQWYTGLAPQDKLQFSPSTENTGINGIGAGQPLTAAELEGRQRALAKEHFMVNIAPVHPDLAPQRQTLEDATLARIQGVPTQAIRNQRIASTPPPEAPEDPKITAQKVRNQGAVDVANIRAKAAADAAAAKPVPPGKTPPATKPAAPVPDGYDHVPTAAEQKDYATTVANWRATDLATWSAKMKAHAAAPTDVADPGPAPKPPAQPWLKKTPTPTTLTPGAAQGPYQGGSGMGSGGGVANVPPATLNGPGVAAPPVTSVAPDYTNNNATAASVAPQTMTPASSIGTALPAQPAVQPFHASIDPRAALTPNRPQAPAYTHTAINPTTKQRIGFNPQTKQWEPIDGGTEPRRMPSPSPKAAPPQTPAPPTQREINDVLQYQFPSRA